MAATPAGGGSRSLADGGGVSAVLHNCPSVHQTHQELIREAVHGFLVQAVEVR